MAPPRKSPLNLILGAGNVGDTSVDPTARFDTPNEVNAYFNAFAARGYYEIDTARIYSPQAPGTSEPRIGAVAAGDRFTLDTKVKSGEPGCHTKEKLLQEINISLEALKVKQINIEEGKFKHWGISNYTAEEVQQFIDICEERGFIKPSVYQGQYNPIVRGGEKDHFPLLRKHNIAFYAYSPAAAGFFAGNHKNIKAGRNR